MTPKEFIEKAIEGGWSPNLWGMNPHALAIDPHPTEIALVMLDPKAWKAVGKVEGWKGTPRITIYNSHGIVEGWYPEMWEYKMIKMIHALAEGSSIEDYLKTL